MTGPNKWAGALLFVLFFSIYILSPNATPFDSRWTVHTALSIIHEGNANLDEYLPLLVRDRFYAIECVDGNKKRSYPLASPADCPSGHYLNFYPVTVALLAVPEVYLLETFLKLGQPWLRSLAGRMTTEPRRRFLQGDLVNSSMLVELLIASFIVAAAGVLMYLIACTVLPSRVAALVAILFALCTPAWSTCSRALWQHGPSMLLLSAALLLLIKGAGSPRMVYLAGVPLAIAFFVRPTNAVPLAVFAVFVFHHYRKQLPGFLLAMVPVVAIHTAITYAPYGTWLPPYSFVSRVNAPGMALHGEVLAALAGNLISPARGLFLYVPVFLFCIPGLRTQEPWEKPAGLRWYLAAALLLHWLLISCYEDWWGGHCYGPRYFSDVTPFFVYLLIPTVRSLAQDGLKAHAGRAAAFLVLLAASFFVEQQGAMNWACYQWNMCPTNVRYDPGRIWDWSDPQFLRGFRPPPLRCAAE